jgi:hypothetical protein
MRRAAAILLVVYSSFMLGKAPCCRIHDFTGSAPSAAPRAEVAGAHARGPGQSVCPCCEKPVRHENGQPERRFGKACTCPPLIASIVNDSDVVDPPLALPFDGTFLPGAIGATSTAVVVHPTRAPPTGPRAHTLPLLL